MFDSIIPSVLKIKGSLFLKLNNVIRGGGTVLNILDTFHNLLVLTALMNFTRSSLMYDHTFRTEVCFVAAQ